MRNDLIKGHKTRKVLKGAHRMNLTEQSKIRVGDTRVRKNCRVEIRKVCLISHFDD